MSKDSDNNRGAPSVSEWQLMFSTLERELESLRGVEEDDSLDDGLREDARLQGDETRRVLFQMRESRGFLPGAGVRL